MGRIMDSLTSFFTNDDWTYDAMEDGQVLRMGFSADDGQWTCFAQAREEADQFVFYSRAPIQVPPERRAAMAEFITRANYGLVVGNFEMDFSDGEVRYKTSIDVEGAALIDELIKPIVYANVTMMSQYLKGILAVSFGGIEPEAAIKTIEG